jgi:hypothetical protein
MNNQASLIISSYLMISLKLGRLLGSDSQHLFISFVQASGVLAGTGGLSSRLSTSYDTLVPLMFLYGGSLEAISHRIIE